MSHVTETTEILCFGCYYHTIGVSFRCSRSDTRLPAFIPGSLELCAASRHRRQGPPVDNNLLLFGSCTRVHEFVEYYYGH